MALFSFGKKKKKSEQTAPGSPIDQIMALKQQGMVNDQIIQELEKQGYNSSQIFDALNQVNIQGTNAEAEQPPSYGSPQNFSYEQPPRLHEPPMQEVKEETMSREQIEEIAESIIDEKWKEFEEDARVIIEWKEKTEVRISHLDQQIKDLASSLNSLHKNIINKISDYDKNISDVGTEIKAMEKVFQKILPSLTENVNKLERITKGSKSKK
jgi:DNA-binding transcriptional MerR regulator